MKKLILSMVMALVVISLLSVPHGESALRANVVTDRVLINGITLNNFNARFPVLKHRGMHYFPMTYQMAARLGVLAHYVPETGLHVTRTGRIAEFVPDEGTFNRTSLVQVAAVNYPVWVNGSRVNNAREQWPLLNYRGITYFPLTERFASREFSWTIRHDAQSGLSVSSLEGARDAEADVLNILNRAYFTPRAFVGSLMELSTQAVSFFGAATRVTHTLTGTPASESTRVEFAAEPFVFSAMESATASREVVAEFRGEHESDWGIMQVFRTLPPMGERLISGSAFAESEKAYLLRSFLRLRFVGESGQRVLSMARVDRRGDFETWELNVHLPDEGFSARPRIFVVRVTVLIDTRRGQVLTTVLENNRYRLRLAGVGEN